MYCSAAAEGVAKKKKKKRKKGERKKEINSYSIKKSITTPRSSKKNYQWCPPRPAAFRALEDDEQRQEYLNSCNHNNIVCIKLFPIQLSHLF